MLSKPISVEPGKSYILTGLYHTSDLRFGNAGAIAVLTDSQATNWPDKRELFRPYSPLASGELVNRKRLAVACMLLKYTNLPISEISANVGYGHENYFFTLFRRTYGVSPRAYRKEALSAPADHAD